ncbi:MAG: O-phosphoserine--tRNA ligase [Candidatus Altiarchaeota archaeon]|nr:O-phosphoserine--tRNA ligase [Candidatus Altiarchaeota archaeon]
MKTKRGKPHPVQEIMQETRRVFLDLGFDEVENQIFIPEEDIYKQYGSEAPIILDRCYYLAGLPRPDIGLGKKQREAIEGIKPGFDFNAFTGILRGYREGSIEGDNLAEEMVGRLKLGMGEALSIIDLIPEFKSITPVASKITLRSHMTAAWFPTIAAMQDNYELPLRLFSIGLRFRREQKVDSTHLRAHYGASCVVMDKDFDIEDGKRLSSDVLTKLGFGNNRFVQKRATSNYYADGTEFEVYSKDIEIADCGMYSKASLSNYGVRYPAFNLGFGLERMLMLRLTKGDVREIMYPQFYEALELSDEEIAKQVDINVKPKTDEGRQLVDLLVREASRHSDEQSPCEFRVYGGDFLGRMAEVLLVEREENTKLLGPAALNDVYVYGGSIYGVPKKTDGLDKKLIDVGEKGIPAGFSFLEAVMNLFAAEAERMVGEGEGEGFFQVKMAKTPADLNIVVGEVARRFITSKNGRIYLRGPVFTAVRITLV